MRHKAAPAADHDGVRHQDGSFDEKSPANPEGTPFDNAETELMFDIVCSVDHSPDGAPAGKVLARVRLFQDWLDQYESAYPNCELSAVPIEAPADTARGGLGEPEVYEKHRHRATMFDRPTVVTEPRVFPRARS